MTSINSTGVFPLLTSISKTFHLFCPLYTLRYKLIDIAIQFTWKSPHFSFTEPTAEIIGAPDLYIESGSTINLTCVVHNSPEPPAYIFWNHNHAVSITPSFFLLCIFSIPVARWDGHVYVFDTYDDMLANSCMLFVIVHTLHQRRNYIF